MRAIWRPKYLVYARILLNKLIRIFYFFYYLRLAKSCQVFVGVGMIPNAMPSIERLLDERSMTSDVLSDDKKRSNDLVLVQYLKDLVGIAGVRPIIKCEPDTLRRACGITRDEHGLPRSRQLTSAA